MSPRPTSGARFELVRDDPEARGAVVQSVRYRGFVRLPDADLRLEAEVDLATGVVRTQIVPGAASGGVDLGALERTAGALVRSVTKNAVSSARPLPRKITRWRA